MNIKMAINSQLSTTESKKKQTQQTTRTGRESEMEITWRPAGRGKGENGRKGTGSKSRNW